MKLLIKFLLTVTPCILVIACNGGNFAGRDNQFSSNTGGPNRTVGPDEELPPGSNLTGSNPRGTCNKSFQVALVIDSSASMKHPPNAVDNSGANGPNSKLNQVKAAATGFIQSLAPEDTIGIASFANGSQRLVNSTNDKNAAINALQQLVADGGTNISAGLEEGYALLPNLISSNQVDANGQLVIQQPVLILLSDGKKQESTDPRDVANQIKANIPNIKIITIGYDLSPDAAGIMTDIASSPALYLYDQPGTTIYDTFRSITDNLCSF